MSSSPWDPPQLAPPAPPALPALAPTPGPLATPSAPPSPPVPARPQQPTPSAPAGVFRFDGGAATYIGTALLGLLLTVVTFGICYPFALMLMERWHAKHTTINGYRLRFVGSATGLFARWLLWLLLIFVTCGIYGFWVTPRIARWKVERRG